ncbi:hypothetical protein [Haemophilus influenzae]|uniref:hypothetical protein n=1 Tax=Haemophilus influenzae TaxID=727 RepID=UPI000ABE1024|nr:hypothetical protein [Haemophilus influenzae]
MPTLQCEFWNVGQGLFSSGRIQMGDAPAFHWVYGLQVPNHGSKPILVNKNKRLSIHSI